MGKKANGPIAWRLESLPGWRSQGSGLVWPDLPNLPTFKSGTYRSSMVGTDAGSWGGGEGGVLGLEVFRKGYR